MAVASRERTPLHLRKSLVKLLGIDLDGTLLRQDKTISRRDRAAIALARRAGVVVTLVTGRLLSSTLSVAEDLALDGLLVCADGGLVASCETGVVSARFPMARADVAHALLLAETGGLGGFALLDDSIHYDDGAAIHATYAAGWTPNLRRHPRLSQTAEARGDVLGFIAIGAEAAVKVALASMAQHCASTTCLTFGMGDGQHALKLTPVNVDKATGLRHVAEQLQIDRADVVTVGDWFNDVAMLEWAGTSFSMGGAPEAVRAVATFGLEARAHAGGGVAEVIERVLGLRVDGA
jgi:Cof subfamily protein (haloacid dehalogenase superfamily)